MFDLKNILFYLLTLPLLGVVILVFIPSSERSTIKKVGFRISCVTFFVSCYIWSVFNKSLGTFQLVTDNTWISILNLNLNLGVDGISLFFVLLTTLLIALCILVSWNSVTFNLKEYLISFLIMEFFLIGVFCVLDLLLFYIFFESVLIPMFLIIGIWGSRERKIRAAYFFLVYIIRFYFNVIVCSVYICASRYY